MPRPANSLWCEGNPAAWECDSAPVDTRLVLVLVIDERRHFAEVAVVSDAAESARVEHDHVAAI